jgi:guanosine-3',5'-bis(diphosphate) 3'-pyrophosphohydrolase
MVDKRLSFTQVLDIYGFRIVVRDVPTCYLALGALHGLYKPVPGKFKDYIAIPKANGYQSLHTTLIGPYGTPVEVQIRTAEMHRVGESGVASHWLYKDEVALNELQRKTHLWLQSLIELQKTSGDSSEFLEHVKIDLFPDEVYVFTPQGKILPMPRGATAVDFAYAVHTDIGNRCVACRINQELVPLRTELRNGDQVEIITASHANPNPAWLAYVKTGKARAQIRHFLKTQQTEESAALGQRLLNQALRLQGVDPASVTEVAWERFLRASGVKLRDEILTDIGLGKRLAAIVGRRLTEGSAQNPPPDGEPAKSRPSAPIMIRGSDGMAVQIARCCRPIPGDPILGLIRKGQGLEIHTHECPAAAKTRSERDRWVDVEWELADGKLYEVAIRVVIEDRRGVLGKVTTEIANAESNILNVGMDQDRNAHTLLHFTLQVTSRQHLARVMRNVRRIPEVIRISRLRGEA